MKIYFFKIEASELRKLLNGRAEEVDEWRKKYLSLEREYLNFRKNNIHVLTTIKDTEKDALNNQILSLSEELNMWQMKCYAIE